MNTKLRSERLQQNLALVALALMFVALVVVTLARGG